MKNIVTRLIMYFCGLFILALGVAASVKADFGVSPVSSIPYTAQRIWGIDMGVATVIYYTVLLGIEALVLRRDFKVIYLMQFFVGLIYGYFTSFTNGVMATVPLPEDLWFRIIEFAASIMLISLGLFFYVPANIMQQPPEGLQQAIAKKAKTDFPKVKICYDVTAVVISITACFIAFGSLVTVSIGTVVTALSVGPVLRFMNRRFGKYRDGLLK